MPTAWPPSGTPVFVAGMIGWDGDSVFHSDDLAEQARQALANVVAVLAEAGAEAASTSCA